MSLEELWQLFPIILTEPNESWNNNYEEEYIQLQHILTNIDITRISHIGSTAINSIWAKPIIDVLIEINSSKDFNKVYDVLTDHGYLCMFKNEKKSDFNKGYTKYGFAEKVFHIHVRLSGNNDELYFRDYLNENPQIAKEYERLKLSLWKTFEHNRDGYTDAKTEFIKKYTAKAKGIYANRYP